MRRYPYFRGEEQFDKLFGKGDEFTCGGILRVNSFEVLAAESKDIDISGNSSQGVLS